MHLSRTVGTAASEYLKVLTCCASDLCFAMHIVPCAQQQLIFCSSPLQQSNKSKCLQSMHQTKHWSVKGHSSTAHNYTLVGAAAAILGVSGKLHSCLSIGQSIQQQQQQQQRVFSQQLLLQQLNDHRKPVLHSADRSDQFSDHSSDQNSAQHPDYVTRQHTELHSLPRINHSLMPASAHHHSQGHMQQPNQTAAQQHQHADETACHALCLGLGGGSLPLFLSHQFPGMMGQAVELVLPC